MAGSSEAFVPHQMISQTPGDKDRQMPLYSRFQRGTRGVESTLSSFSIN